MIVGGMVCIVTTRVQTVVVHRVVVAMMGGPAQAHVNALKSSAAQIVKTVLLVGTLQHVALLVVTAVHMHTVMMAKTAKVACVTQVGSGRLQTGLVTSVRQGITAALAHSVQCSVSKAVVPTGWRALEVVCVNRGSRVSGVVTVRLAFSAKIALECAHHVRRHSCAWMGHEDQACVVALED